MSFVTPSGEKLAAALDERFEDLLRPGEHFAARVEVEGNAIHVGITLLSGSERHEFEVDLRGDRSVGDAFDLAVDAVDAAIGSWLEEDRPRLPGHSEDRTYRGAALHFSARTRRPNLEAEAERLLSEDEKA